MRVLTIVHEADAGPGVFGAVLGAAGADVDLWLAAEQPQPPAPVAAYDAIITFGGAAHPHQEDRHGWLATEKRFLSDALAGDVSLLGVCLGCELIAEAAGARARHMPRPEIGWHEVALTDEGRGDAVLGAAGARFAALEWHSYAVDLPDGAVALATGQNCLQAYRIGDFAWGLQFHAEVSDADFQYWLDHYTEDEDAVRVGIDTQAIARETAARMADWHELGAGICARFLALAADR